MEPTVIEGLEGVYATTTKLSRPDGEKGELIIGGFDLEEIAPNATFEEETFLLWHDRLPKREELREFSAKLAAHREIPKATLDLLRHAAAAENDPMDALRMAVGTLSLRIPKDLKDNREIAYYIIPAFPTIVAAYWRFLNDQESIAPRTDLSHAANYLYMLSGETPSPERTRSLETYLNTVMDHGLNASTFTARVIISTKSDLVSAITGAIGALKGPLHGGAPGPALDMVFEIGQKEKAEEFIQAKLARKERLMGFGHRVYRIYDPRAAVLSKAAEQLFQADGDTALYELARAVEQVALRLLAEYKPDRKLQTNVEYYTALLLHGVGLPTNMFTPTFAIGRVAGWICSCFEQEAKGRLIRPKALYTGDRNRKWVPVEDR